MPGRNTKDWKLRARDASQAKRARKHPSARAVLFGTNALDLR
jgi:hypothetical protein